MILLIDHTTGRQPVQPSKDLDFPVFVFKRDNWDDYGYKTTCSIFYFSNYNETPSFIGSTRIMFLGQGEGSWSLKGISGHLTSLNNTFCSLSTETDYYNRLADLDRNIGISYLQAIRDAAYSPDIWEQFKEDACFNTSLLREQTAAIVMRDSVPKMFGGIESLVEKFTYTVRLPGAINDHEITFDFKKQSPLPNRIMLLVGPNGSGKTQLLANLAIALTGVTTEEGSKAKMQIILDKLSHSGTIDPSPSFYDIITISFNAFDKFEIPKTKEGSRYHYTYCGIRKNETSLCNEEDLILQIRQAVKKMDDNQKGLFVKALQEVLGSSVSDRFSSDEKSDIYKYLSAGQRIVLNILSHLISNLKKRSLILLDEPETHLHPSLMTTLFSEILELLDAFDAYAIIATHSPLIVQQVPMSCIRVIQRISNSFEGSIPDRETFGENLSEISNVLFGSREFERDYTSLIDKLLVDFGGDPNRVTQLFKYGIGSNARVYLEASAAKVNQ